MPEGPGRAFFCDLGRLLFPCRLFEVRTPDWLQPFVEFLERSEAPSPSDRHHSSADNRALVGLLCKKNQMMTGTPSIAESLRKG
jgi:hypothetical protein